MVTLSRPCCARVPIIVPSLTPGLTSGGTLVEQAWTIRAELSRKRWTSIPMMAAGTMPKFDRAEYRPPMLGTPGKMERNWRCWASCWSGLAGSVIAINRAPALSAPIAWATLSKKYCVKTLGSVVPPDFEETINSVLLGSIFCAHASTWAGTVESRTSSSGQPPITPKVRFKTSGHKLEPPMPSRRTC